MVKGSHKMGRVEHGKVGDQTGADPERVAAALERMELVYCELEAGDAILFHANLLHRSDQNKSPDPRWAFICCYNTKTNDPYKESRHPRYSPLEVRDGTTRACASSAEWRRRRERSRTRGSRKSTCGGTRVRPCRDRPGGTRSRVYPKFLDWLAARLPRGMEYLSRRAPRMHPKRRAGGNSVGFDAGVNHAPQPSDGPARVARYALGERDYHDVLRDKLAALCEWLRAERPGCRARGIVDTAPLLERDFARLAGLGWVGKNTLLINKRGELAVPRGGVDRVELETGPTTRPRIADLHALPRRLPDGRVPRTGVLDARKCIAYWTIEHRGPIAADMREGIGEWLFGCDVCQEVCPWNRRAVATTERAFLPIERFTRLIRAELLELDEARFASGSGERPVAPRSVRDVA